MNAGDQSCGDSDEMSDSPTERVRTLDASKGSTSCTEVNHGSNNERNAYTDALNGSYPSGPTVLGLRLFGRPCEALHDSMTVPWSL